MVGYATFNNISAIQCIMAVSFINGGNSNLLKTTDLSQIIDKLYYIVLHQVHLAWTGFKLTTLMAIGNDVIGSYKSNYQTITIAPLNYVTRFSENQSESRIVWLIINRFLCSSTYFKANNQLICYYESFGVFLIR